MSSSRPSAHAVPAWLRVLASYLAAPVAVTLTWVVRVALTPLIGAETPIQSLFFIPIVVVAWTAGLGPGLLTILLAEFVGDALLFDPDIPVSGRIIRAGVFTLVGAAIAIAADSRRRAQQNSLALLALPDDLPHKLEKFRRQRTFWSGWTWLIPVAIISAFFTLFEIIKELTSPQLTKWESHLLSIVVVTVIATVVLYRSRSIIQVQLETISRIAAKLQERDAEARKLALVAAKTSNGVLVTDAHGRIEWANEAMCRMTGRTIAELVGHGPGEVGAGPDTDPATVALMRQRIAEGQPFEVELARYRPDHRRCWVSINAQPIRNPQGQITNFIVLQSDITERKEMWEQLRASEKRARLIVDTALDAVVLIDPAGMVAGWNPQAERMFGRLRRDILHRPLLAMTVAPEDRPRVLAEMKARAAQARAANPDADPAQRSDRLEVACLRADGTRFAAELSVSHLGDSGNIGFSFFIRDISQRKLAEQQLREARDNAEAASRAKSEFLAMMSHEMRTPLNGVIGTLGLVLDGDSLADRQRRFLGLAKSSADSLLTLINDILDFSKIEAGKIELERVPFHLPNLVEDVVELLAPKAQGKGLALYCRIDPRTTAHVRGDPVRLRQILINLVGNAVKFTESGRVVVEAAPLGGNDSHAIIEILVKDTGVGISEDGKKRLFQSFSQVDASTTRKFGGTGLGLAISKQLVEIMGGSISVTSELNQGSTFRFTLRLERAPVPEQERAGTFASKRALRPLVVDGIPGQRASLVEQTLSWGFQPLEAHDRNAARDLLDHLPSQRQWPNILLLNVETSGGAAGLGDWLEAIHARYQLPVILLVPMKWDGDVAAWRRYGVTQVLCTPPRRSALFDAIMSAAAQTPATPTPQPAPQPAPTPTATPVTPATPAGRVLLAEDNPVNQLVASELLKRLGYTVDTAVNGQQALDAVAAKPFDAVLMDCQMPVMDGFTATRQIRQRETAHELPVQELGHRRHLPIIALTANAIKGDRERCLDAGMDAYLTKPIDPQLLASTLAELLASRPAPEPQPAPAAPPETTAPIDTRELLNRCMGDASFAEKVLAAFRDQAVAQLQELVAAAKAKDAPALGRIAHAMKGAAANLAASRLRECALTIETQSRAGSLQDIDQQVAQLQTELDRCLAWTPPTLGSAIERR